MTTCSIPGDLRKLAPRFLTTCLILAIMSWTSLQAQPASAEEAVEIGSRRELFVDRTLVESLSDGVTLELQKPEPQEVALVTDAPWEGNTCAYYTVFEDDGLYRMYYRGSHSDAQKKATHPEFACYAESKDGIHWTKPKLGLFEFQGSSDNNIVWSGVGTHNFTPFKDANPEAPPEARYKAVGRGRGGLYAFQSADAIHWKLMSEKPVITKGAFDSQNLAYWDPVRKEYREYHRVFTGGVRDISTATTTDFLSWPDPVLLKYPGSPAEHLYTNAILPYPRAPHLFIGFPTRFLPKTQQVEPKFMASRDGRTFHRWPDPVIPITAPEDRDGNRSNYMAWGLVQLPDAPDQYSVYATEAYYAGTDSRVRRFTYRVDGFVAAHGSEGGGTLTTKPVKFDGRQLLLNFRSARSGSVRVELQDADGNSLDGYSLSDCEPARGDETAWTVKWKGGSDLTSLTGKPVRIVFELKSADLYSYKFDNNAR